MESTERKGVSVERRTLALGMGVTAAFAFAFAVAEQGAADVVLLGLFAVAALATNVYVVVYWFRPWRSTQQGEALMVKAWGNVILLNLGFATLAFGEDYWGRDFFRVLGLTAFTVGICYLLWTLLTSPGARDYPPRSCWKWWKRER